MRVLVPKILMRAVSNSQFIKSEAREAIQCNFAYLLIIDIFILLDITLYSKLLFYLDGMKIGDIDLFNSK